MSETKAPAMTLDEIKAAIGRGQPVAATLALVERVAALEAVVYEPKVHLCEPAPPSDEKPALPERGEREEWVTRYDEGFDAGLRRAMELCRAHHESDRRAYDKGHEMAGAWAFGALSCIESIEAELSLAPSLPEPTPSPQPGAPTHRCEGCGSTEGFEGPGRHRTATGLCGPVTPVVSLAPSGEPERDREDCPIDRCDGSGLIVHRKEGAYGGTTRIELPCPCRNLTEPPAPVEAEPACESMDLGICMKCAQVGRCFEECMNHPASDRSHFEPEPPKAEPASTDCDCCGGASPACAGECQVAAAARKAARKAEPASPLRAEVTANRDGVLLYDGTDTRPLGFYLHPAMDLGSAQALANAINRMADSRVEAAVRDAEERGAATWHKLADVAERGWHSCSVKLKHAANQNENLRRVLRRLCDELSPCPPDMHPAWCSTHLAKHCEVNAILAEAHAILQETTTPQQEDVRPEPCETCRGERTITVGRISGGGRYGYWQRSAPCPSCKKGATDGE